MPAPVRSLAASPLRSTLIASLVGVAASSCVSSTNPAPAARETTVSAPVAATDAIALADQAASAARSQSYTATYQVGEDADSSARVFRRPAEAVVVLAGTRIGSSDATLGSATAPISLYLRVQAGTVLVACGTEAGETRCYDLAPLRDAQTGDSGRIERTPVFGTTAGVLSFVPAVLPVEPIVFEELAAELRRAMAEGLVLSVGRRPSAAGDLRCLAVAETEAALDAGESEGFCVNDDGVRATSIDASDEFASTLVAYEPAVDPDVFLLPARVEPLAGAAPPFDLRRGVAGATQGDRYR